MSELVLMAEGKKKHDWDITSHLMTLLANLHRDPKKGRAHHPCDFNPYRVKKPIKKTKDLKILKDVFVTKGKNYDPTTY